jgi:hypothetical protein
MGTCSAAAIENLFKSEQISPEDLMIGIDFSPLCGD